MSRKWGGSPAGQKEAARSRKIQMMLEQEQKASIEMRERFETEVRELKAEIERQKQRIATMRPMGSVDSVMVFGQRLPGTEDDRWEAWQRKFKAAVMDATLSQSAASATVVQQKEEILRLTAVVDRLAESLRMAAEAVELPEEARRDLIHLADSAQGHHSWDEEPAQEKPGKETSPSAEESS